MKPQSGKISAETVRGDFNDPLAVVHYARAARQLGLWASERRLIERFLPDTTTTILEAGCGAGRGALGLWNLGYRSITAFDFAEKLVEEAHRYAAEQNAGAINFHQCDATKLTKSSFRDAPFDAVIFLFNGLMQIPGRDNRRKALAGLRELCRADGVILFTTHDRASSPTEKMMWRLEKGRWDRGEEDSRLLEFGDRYFEDEAGRTFMHLPDRSEIVDDLEATGWKLAYDSLRRDVAIESNEVLDFSDECRFWVARNQI